MHAATGLAPVRTRLADQPEETDIAYRDSPIVATGRADHSGPRPGDAAPDVPGIEPALHTVLAAATGHSALYVAGTHVVPAPIELDDTDVRHVLVGPDSDNAAFDQVSFDPGRLIANRYDIGVRGELVMVRPDGYIGLRTSIDDQAAVESYLAGILA